MILIIHVNAAAYKRTPTSEVPTPDLRKREAGYPDLDPAVPMNLIDAALLC